jgi:8-oxo-dGTP pyrophosphatase MutT (NUDIX family)
MSENLRIAVPTATMIVARRDNGFMVAALRPTKHKGKIVFPGGRIKIGQEDVLGCAVRELEEEIGLKVEGTSLQFFTCSQKPGRDVRPGMKMGKYNEGLELSPEIATISADAYFCFDFAFSLYVPSDTVLKGDGAEGEPFWLDLSTTKPEEFALDHGDLAKHWAAWLKDARKPKFGEL